MAVSIAKTTFETGADNKLATIDIYGDPATVATNIIAPAASQNAIDTVTGKQKANNATDLLSKIQNAFSSPIKGVPDLLKTIDQNVSAFKSMAGKGLNNQALGVILKDLGYTGSTSGLTVNLKNGGALKDITALVGNYDPGSKVYLDAVTKISTVKDLGSVTGLINAANALMGDNALMKAVGADSNLSIYKSLVSEAIKYKLPQMADKLIASLDDPADQNTVALFSSSDAAKVGNVDYLLGLINNPAIGPSAIIKLDPNIIKDLLSNYSLNNNGSIKNSINTTTTVGTTAVVPTINDANKLYEVITALNSNWLSYSRNGKVVISLELIDGANSLALQTLALLPNCYEATILAKLFPSKTGLNYSTTTVTNSSGTINTVTTSTTNSNLITDTFNNYPFTQYALNNN